MLIYRSIKLVTDGATFIFNRVKSELEVVRKRDGQTASYYNTSFTTRSSSSRSCCLLLLFYVLRYAARPEGAGGLGIIRGNKGGESE